jgi:hypothetical protein
MTKIAGSGSISQRHVSADPDSHQNVMDPQHWCQDLPGRGGGWLAISSSSASYIMYGNVKRVNGGGTAHWCGAEGGAVRGVGGWQGKGALERWTLPPPPPPPPPPRGKAMGSVGSGPISEYGGLIKICAPSSSWYYCILYTFVSAP